MEKSAVAINGLTIPDGALGRVDAGPIVAFNE